VILVDTSVWIDHLNDNQSDEVGALRRLVGFAPLIVGDLILCEILQGLRSDREAAIVERALNRFESVSLVTPSLAVKAAANYRFLRGKGITIRKTIDLLIATFCIENRHALLHSDRDFDQIEAHLGLQVIQPDLV
jgi:predicted nucleic acid-binding protein